MNAPLAIAARNIVYRYRHADVDALQGVDLTVPQGSIFGLLGPNGAGKSTLLSLLSGSLHLQQGSIEIAGAHDAKTIKSVGAIVPQEYAFYEDLTGLENMQHFAGVYGLSGASARERMQDCAAMCRLTDSLSKRAGFYSGGLKRRLNLAIGLLNRPQILYLDEPTVGIDAESRQFIVEAIHDLRRTGITIVYTSHYMEEVERLCDSLAIIDRGRVVVQEKMEALLEKDGGKTLHVRLHAPAPQLESAWAAYRPEHREHRHWHLELTADQLPVALAELPRAGARIERVQYGISRLEKIYLQLLTHDTETST